MKILATINAEGFSTQIVEQLSGIVGFQADGDIDADGANGQNGGRAAYMVDDKGSEFLANGGMAMRNGKVVGVQPWFRDIVMTGSDGEPLVTPEGIIPSRTAYHYPDRPTSDPRAYVDSETVPYITVPPIVVKGVRAIVLGCRCVVTNLLNDATEEGVVADVGPRTRIGEISIAMARRLRLNPNPRNGGIDKPYLRYTVYPGIPANVNGIIYKLQRS